MSQRLLQAMTVSGVLLASAFPWGEAGAAAGSGSGGDAVVFVAQDYGFTGPDRIPAGMTTVQVRNEGKEPHHVQILQLTEGKTAADFQAAMKADPAHPPQWAKFVGGPNAVLPGSDATSMMQLTAGNYLLLCLIPDQKGVPHVALGMAKPLTVTPSARTVSTQPAADLSITTTDFAFALSQPMRAGAHTIHVMNAGGQQHEVVVVKLDPGKTAKDFGEAFEPGASGPPPGRPLGGIVGLERGGSGFFTGNFEPGRYGLICFFPDHQTGAPHFAKGMTLDFTVR
ncbi:hypothetical protein ACO9S2_04735 [Nitrospira sp. NS4]|uniref:hypothetical protein n=1 Tax=Nitrospira sp. NS4 TaxID=3414498 RepID=UPI003C2BA289